MARARLITITLNTAIDRVIEAPGFAVGAHIECREIARLPAGKGINVARALAMLGHRCIAAGLVGRGELAWFEERLRAIEAGRMETCLTPIDGTTRECLTIRDPEARTETHLRGPGVPITDADADRLAARVQPLVDSESIVAFCGSVPPGAGLTCFLSFLRACRERGARIAVDTSGAALAAVQSESFWMLKINAEELAALTGRRTNTLRQVITAARSLCVQRTEQPRCVVVTRGRLGAVAVRPRVALNARAPAIQRRIVGTVGCGDAFFAGLLSSQSHGADWPESIRMGIAAAAAHAVSATPGTFSRRDVARFFRATSAETIQPE